MFSLRLSKVEPKTANVARNKRGSDEVIIVVDTVTDLGVVSYLSNVLLTTTEIVLSG